MQSKLPILPGFFPLTGTGVYMQIIVVSAPSITSLVLIRSDMEIINIIVIINDCVYHKNCPLMNKFLMDGFKLPFRNND